MGLGDRHKNPLVGHALALMGILLFTALVPGHLVSQATALVGDPESELIVEMACHNGMAMPAAVPDPDTPSTPQEKCPFCEGYAAFVSALASSPDSGVIDAEHIRIAVASIDDDTVEHIAKHTRSRGPPRSL